MVQRQPILIAKLRTPDAIYSLASHMVLITGHDSHIHQQSFAYNQKSLHFLSSVLKRHVQSNSTRSSWICSKTPFSPLVTFFVAYFSSMWSCDVSVGIFSKQLSSAGTSVEYDHKYNKLQTNTNQVLTRNLCSP